MSVLDEDGSSSIEELLPEDEPVKPEAMTYQPVPMVPSGEIDERNVGEEKGEDINEEEEENEEEGEDEGTLNGATKLDEEDETEKNKFVEQLESRRLVDSV